MPGAEPVLKCQSPPIVREPLGGPLGVTVGSERASKESWDGWICFSSGALLSCFKVENWNPLTDTVPIHSWIHPWLPLMQARLEPLYSPIRNKLANALQKWHPSDSSAKLILQPWKDVFTPGSWEAFMVKNIVPKLGESAGRQ